MIVRFAVVCFLAVLLVAPGTAHAYLDPASGSLILQLVLGGVAGLSVAVKVFWGRIRNWFGGNHDTPDDDGSGDSPD